MKADRCDRGYVMLVVIAVLILVITLLGTLANRSLRRGLEAADAQRSLQQRWGALTLEHTLMSQASKPFEVREALAAVQTPGEPPPPFLRGAITMGGVMFDLLLADEDAKVNLNALYHHAGEGQTNRAAAALVPPGAGRWLRLQPAVPARDDQQRKSITQEDEDVESEAPRAFRSWGEVFDLRSLGGETGGRSSLPILTTGMTCWGSGQLNFRRASDQAILAVAGTVIQDGGARRLVNAYRRSPTATLPVLLQTEVTQQRDRDKLLQLMSETSSHFSLWIDASVRGAPPLRRLTVQRRDLDGVTQQIRFAE